MPTIIEKRGGKLVAAAPPSGGSGGVQVPTFGPRQFSIYIKGEGAPATSWRGGYWNALEPATGKFRMQASLSSHFADGENSLLRQCVAYCAANPSAEVLLGVYNGSSGGSESYHLFAARLTAEQTGGGGHPTFFDGIIVRALPQCPVWQPAPPLLPTLLPAAHRAACSRAALPSPAPPPLSPRQHGPPAAAAEAGFLELGPGAAPCRAMAGRAAALCARAQVLKPKKVKGRAATHPKLCQVRWGGHFWGGGCSARSNTCSAKKLL